MSGELYKVTITGHIVDKNGDGDPIDWEWYDLIDAYHFVTEPEVETRELTEVIYNKVNGKFYTNKCNSTFNVQYLEENKNV